MAEYKNIKGFKVQTVSTDPAVSNLGQVFYNSTANAFKVTKQSVPAGTWASGGSLNTARSSFSWINERISNSFHSFRWLLRNVFSIK
jgi:hypothetical protein